MSKLQTPFSKIYDIFLGMITDDLYLELDKHQTYELLQELLLSAIVWFEFPRQNLDDYDDFDLILEQSTYCGVDSDMLEVKCEIYNHGHFNCVLTNEEMNIIATYMVVEWLGQQLASIENTRMKYSGQD